MIYKIFTIKVFLHFCVSVFLFPWCFRELRNRIMELAEMVEFNAGECMIRIINKDKYDRK